MPLTNHKAWHMLQAITRSFAGRQRTITVVSRIPAGYHYTAIQAILRPLSNHDPRLPDRHGQPTPDRADSWLIAPISTDLTGAIFIADTPIATATAVAGAAKYELVEIIQAGMLPNGSHLRIALRRMR